MPEEKNNSYWEQVAQKYNSVTDDDLIQRIKECQFVIDKLEKDELWSIVIRDVNRWVDDLDRRWQDTYDDNLFKARVVKLACVHLKDLKAGYVAEWKNAQGELERRNDPNTIERDMEN